MAPFVRRMTAADVDAVGRIQGASLPDSASGWKAADFLPLTSYIVEHDAEVVAFLVARSLPGEEYELLNMAVAPAHRRRGMAKYLLKTVLETHPGTWFLEVRESNIAARTLYQALHFQYSGSRRGYYRDPPEDAIEMTKVS
jgi:[ribosomal protein S18]-alanine N-acetyltransferase